MINTKTAFVTFFPINPNNMGSSTVVNSRFKTWPGKKKIFQISHVKNINKKNIKTIFINKENPINKIKNLPKMVFEINNYLKYTKNKVVVIEGASWIFYSFFIIFALKIISTNFKIIYISHSIESEIRKKYSNKFIFYLTKFLENLVFKYSDVSTSVSKKEKSKILKIYNKKTKLYPNAIDITNVKPARQKIHDYIIYSGSYQYKPNKEAIDFLKTKY